MNKYGKRGKNKRRTKERAGKWEERRREGGRKRVSDEGAQR